MIRPPSALIATARRRTWHPALEFALIMVLVAVVWFGIIAWG